MSIPSRIIVDGLAFAKTSSDDSPDKERARSLGTDHHMWRASKNRIYKRVENEGIEAVDGGDVGDARRE
jgi:hypothetical protein